MIFKTEERERSISGTILYVLLAIYYAACIYGAAQFLKLSVKVEMKRAIVRDSVQVSTSSITLIFILLCFLPQVRRWQYILLAVMATGDAAFRSCRNFTLVGVGAPLIFLQLIGAITSMDNRATRSFRPVSIKILNEGELPYAIARSPQRQQRWSLKLKFLCKPLHPERNILKHGGQIYIVSKRSRAIIANKSILSSLLLY
jgi:hypothetical protein